MKKMLVAVMILVMTVSTICGCGKSEDASETNDNAVEEDVKEDNTEKESTQEIVTEEESTTEDKTEAQSTQEDKTEEDKAENNNDENVDDGKWLDAYDEYLNNNYADIKDSINQYNFVFIDDDTVPELVMSYGFGSCLAFTYYKGKVEVICNSSHLDFGYVEKSGYYYTGGMNGGDRFYNNLYYGQTEGIASCTQNPEPDTYELVYLIGEQSATEDEFNNYVSGLGNFIDGYTGASDSLQAAYDKISSGDNEKKVEYGSRIKVHFLERARGAISEAKGKSSDEFVTMKEGEDEFVVSMDNLIVFCPYDYEVDDDTIMGNVNKAVGLKVGDSFVIGCEGGDGYYETEYEILEIY